MINNGIEYISFSSISKNNKNLPTHLKHQFSKKISYNVNYEISASWQHIIMTLFTFWEVSLFFLSSFFFFLSSMNCCSLFWFSCLWREGITFDYLCNTSSNMESKVMLRAAFFSYTVWTMTWTWNILYSSDNCQVYSEIAVHVVRNVMLTVGRQPDNSSW